MREKKYLIKNIGFLTISQFGTKILSFLLVPLYTNVLTTAEYGTYDLYASTVTLLVPILTLNMADSLLRFPLDKSRNRKEIFMIGMKYFLLSAIIVFVLTGINGVCNIASVLKQYALLFILLFVVTSINGMIVNFARGIERIKEAAISGVVSTFVIIILNVIFLIPLKLGIIGYFFANILGVAVQSIYLFISSKLWQYVRIHHLNKGLEREMAEYSKPLMINGISWWVSSSSDRYIVTFFRGIAENGIYAVGYKIPSILSVFQTIFGQAWTISAVLDFDAEDKKGFFSDMYKAYSACMVIVCSFLIVFTKILARLLYAKEFYEAWKYVPFLLIAVVFGALSGYIGGIFAAVKDTKVFAKTSIIGAFANVIMNCITIMMVGTIGAAVSTAVSYIIVWILRLRCVKRYIRLKLNIKRDVATYIILCIQSLLLFLIDFNSLLYTLEGFLLICVIASYHNELKQILSFTINRGDE